MPHDDWKYIESQFETATEGSHRRMHTLATDHAAKLAGAKAALPALVPLHDRFQPVLARWNAGYNAWKDSEAFYAGATEALAGKLAALTRLQPETGSPLSNWANAIAVKHPRTSAAYKAIFPRGMDPFHTGTYDEQISAVAQLATRVAAAGAPLAAVAAEIATFSTDLSALRRVQGEKESQRDTARSAMEPLRLEVCELLYGNLGLLMDLHRKNRPAIANYFDLQTLRETGPDEEPVTPTPPAPSA